MFQSQLISSHHALLFKGSRLVYKSMSVSAIWWFCHSRWLLRYISLSALTFVRYSLFLLVIKVHLWTWWSTRMELSQLIKLRTVIFLRKMKISSLYTILLKFWGNFCIFALKPSKNLWAVMILLSFFIVIVI